MPKQRPKQQGKETQSDELRQRMQDKEFLAGQELTSINPETRTVDCIFFTGIDVPRTDWWTGQKYTLRFDPKGGDFSQLNNGAPILDNHSSWNGSADQKGVVEKAWQEGKNSKATLRFSKRPEIDGLWQDIQDKIVTKFSMGVSILREEKFVENNTEVRLAKQWRPFELSVAPIPADFGTTTLSAVDSDNNMGTRPEGEEMSKETLGTGAQVEASVELIAKPVDEIALKRQATADERKRIAEIREIGLKHKMDENMITLSIENGTSAVDFGKEVLNALAKRSETQNIRSEHTDLVVDERDKRRLAMEIALDGMFDPKNKKADNGNDFMGLSIKRFAEESVRRQHNLNRIPSQDDVVKLAMQTSADFAYVLENSARKQLFKQYELVNPSYRTWCKASSTPDFKTMSRIRLSEAPSLIKVKEGAQVTIAPMSDVREQYAIETYGRGVSFTRQMLINDDLNAFNDLIGQFGAQTARAENKIVYAILYANAVMADSVALFYASHGNLGTGALGNTGYDNMYTYMRGQKGLDGVSILNITPRYIIVPVAKETTARMSLVQITGNVKAPDQNYFAGRFDVVSDAELDNNGSGTTVWYAAADPAIYPGIEYCFLEGQSGPQFIRQDNQNGVLGIQFYCFEDFGAKAVDYRALYKSSGS